MIFGNVKKSASVRLGILLSLALSFWPLHSHAAEELCAIVKIEIAQELTLERQGFEAIMRITNSLDTFALEDITVTVDFADANGDTVTATSDTNATDAEFFIRVDNSHQVSNLQTGNNGDVLNGRIAQNATAEIRWLIIPTANAAGESDSGELFFVGATLAYSFGGEEEVVQVAPDSIIVKPQPLLALDYFLTEEVVADDAFTTEIEPPEPYTLGIRIRNTGFGAAPNLQLESAQPNIVDNELGLAVDFAIKASFIEDQAAAPSLLLDFGIIPPQDVVAGRWIMESSLSGEFTAFSASFTHADALGGELTSLLSSTDAYLLEHNVQVDLAGRDSVLDFLATVAGQLYVLESEPTGISDNVCQHCVPVSQTTGSIDSGESLARVLTATASTGFTHIKIADPFAGEKVLTRVVRSDGKTLNQANAWISQNRADDDRSFDHFVNVFDIDSTASYNLYFADTQAAPQAPIIQALIDRNTHEGGQVGFLVQSYDANNTIPSLSHNGLPTGASFDDKDTGVGVFSWFPAVGQAGSYQLTFKASDGVLSSERSVTIRVNSADDKDGDGLNDDWELANFGDLDEDGNGDLDEDGRTNQQEFDNGTDPNIAELAPGIPSITTPIFAAEILTGASEPYLPSLAVDNAAHSASLQVVYVFEVFSDSSLTELVASATVPEGGINTVWQVASEDLDNGQSFNDNQRYYWRVRAQTDETTPVPGESSFSEFFINSANDAPGTIVANAPIADATVALFTPSLTTSNATDIDGDALTYSFELYHEDDSNNVVAQVAGLQPGDNGQTTWQVPVDLAEDNYYLWRAIVEDEHGAQAATGLSRFLVSTANNAPTAPSIVFPAVGSEVTSLQAANLTLTVNNGQDPEGLALQYLYELDTVNSFDSVDLQQSELIAEQDVTTSWQALGLVENSQYFWRVKSTDGEVQSDFALGDFVVNTIEEAPSPVSLLNPIADAVVETLQPLLQVSTATDPDGDAVAYRFEIYRDAALTDLVAQQLLSSNQWSVDFDLDDNSHFYWRAQSQDENLQTSDWSAGEHFVTNENGINDAPTFSFLLPNTEIELTSPVVNVQWTDTDPDSAALIQLYYRDEASTDVLIVANLSEDADGTGDQYSWDASALLPGRYKLIAEIFDGESTVVAESCCDIVVPQTEKTVTVTPLTALQTDEAGVVVAQVEVSLDQSLGDNEYLVLNYSISSGEGRILGDSYLQFDPSNWQQPQTISVVGNDDCLVDGDVSFTLVFAAIESDDDAYQGSVLESISFVNRDNEVPGQILIMCGYQLQQQSAVDGDGNVEFEYKARLLNLGATLQSAQAQLSILSSPLPDADMILVSGGLVDFDVLLSGVFSVSSNSFTVKYKPSAVLDQGKLQWLINAGTTSDVIEGSASNNTLTGTAGNDVLDGKAGNDTLRAGDGNDVLIGGEGSDYLYGEGGDDRFLIEGLQNYADRFNGGAGYDVIVGSDLDDGIRISSYSGSNTVEEINGGAGVNWLLGTSSNNTLDFRNTLLVAISGIDALGGNDTVYGSQGDDLIVGNAGSDYLYGEGGDDTFSIVGIDSGFDRVNGGAGNDKVLGSSGNDYFRFSSYSGSNTVELIDGVAGTDIIEGSSSNNTLDFRATQLTNIAKIMAQAGNDTVYGSAGADTIVGGLGSDYLYGDGGDDIFLLTLGDTGYDRFNGGAGVDRVAGTSQDDSLRLSTYSGSNTVEVIDGDGGLNVIVGSSSNNTLDFSGTELISITSIDGGAGNDTIKGSANADQILGGVGSDYLYGNGGDDVFVLTASDTGFDRYNGGEGVDTLLVGDGDNTVRLSTYSGSNTVEVINGGTGTNNIVGSSSNNTLDFSLTSLVNISQIDGGAGNDTIKGSSSSDTLIGGIGSDYLYGNGGDDTFVVTADDTGYDRYNGGEGVDQIVAGDVDSTIRISTFSGSNSVEQINGGGGTNTILGSSSNNTLDFSLTTLLAINAIDAGAGNDTVKGSAGDDRIIGGIGSDYLYGNAGNDVFALTSGDTGFNRYNGGDGTDIIEGSAGDDVIRISSYSGSNTVEVIDGLLGNNSIVGSTSNNTLDFTNTELRNIAEINGDKGNDTIKGSSADDVIIGGEGSDYLSGNDGNDTFKLTSTDVGYNRYTGGNGDDQVLGTDGDDAIRISSFSGANTVETINGGLGDNSIVGSSSNNTLDFSNTNLLAINRIFAANGNDTVKGSPGNDTIEGGLGSDYLYGNAGDDIFVFTDNDTGFDRYNGGEGFDTLVAGSADDQIRISSFSGSNTVERIDGGAGNNSIWGSSSNNTLDFSATELLAISRIFAGNGNDTIRGSAANDVIEGGLGSDYLYGNGGDDTFMVTAGDVGYDRVNGGEGFDTLLGTNGDDVIRFSSYSGDNVVELIDGNDGEDIIQGSTGNNQIDFSTTSLVNIKHIDALRGNDTVKGSQSADVIIAGEGNDYLYGNNGADTYVFGRGDGIDSLRDSGSDGAQDLLLLGDSIALEDVWLVNNRNSLEIYLLAGSEKIIIYYAFTDINNVIETIQVSSGEKLSWATLTPLIDFMTAIGAPSAGVVVLTAQQQVELNTLRAAAWQ